MTIQDVLLFIKEYQILSSIIIVAGQTLWAKYIFTKNKLLNKVFSNKIDESFNQLTSKHDKDFTNLLQRMEQLEKTQEGFKKSLDKLFSTVNQWLGNVDNLTHLVLEALPKIPEKIQKKVKWKPPTNGKK